MLLGFEKLMLIALNVLKANLKKKVLCVAVKTVQAK